MFQSGCGVVVTSNGSRLNSMKYCLIVITLITIISTIIVTLYLLYYTHVFYFAKIIPSARPILAKTTKTITKTTTTTMTTAMTATKTETGRTPRKTMSRSSAIVQLYVANIWLGILPGRKIGGTNSAMSQQAECRKQAR